MEGRLEGCGWGMAIQNRSTIHKKHFWLLRRSVARSQRSVYIGSKYIHKSSIFLSSSQNLEQMLTWKKPQKKFLLEIYILTAFQFWDKKNRSRELGDLNVSNRMLCWGGSPQGDSRAFEKLVSSFVWRLMYRLFVT